ncbi:transglycosylase SLT domain-containing protein [Enterobacter kobei]|nr:transglycosylase SLT domain-containing protein [Enterobacter kobei]
MAGNGIPVLQLDFDDEKIKKLNEIADKFRSALSIGPGGFRVPGGTADNPSTSPPSQATTVRQRDEKGRFIPGQTPAVVPVPGDPAQQQSKPGFFSRMFTRQYSPAKNETDKFFNDFNKQGKQTKKTFDEIDKSLKGTTTSLEKLFKNTVTWGARVLALGAGGTFGYNYMASKVAEQYAGSQGLGMTRGQEQAAHNVYGGRITGIGEIMKGLAAAQNDKSHPLYAAMVNMGIDPEKGAAQNLPKFLAGVSNVLQQYKGTGVSQQALKGHGLESIDVATANQLIANSDRIPQLNQQFGEQSQRLDAALGPGTMASYQDVSAKLADNVSRIGNAFINAIAKLNGPIGRLSDNITSSIEKFLNGRNGKALFDTIAIGLQKLGDWIGGDAFQKDLDDFSIAVKRIALAIGGAIEWLAKYGVKVPESVEDARKSSSFDVQRSPEELKRRGVTAQQAAEENSGVMGFVKAAGDTVLGLISGGKVHTKDIMDRSKAGGWKNYQDGLKKLVSDANDRANLPANLLSAVAEEESSWDPKALNTDSGAAGLFQFTVDSGRRYGLSYSDRYDPEKATSAATNYFQDNLRRYGGDIAKALAQYNGGNAAVDKEGNLSLKMETIKYLMDILPQVQGGLDQHPGIMNQLGEAKDTLASAGGNGRATINLQIQQAAGYNINAQVEGITLARR